MTTIKGKHISDFIKAKAEFADKIRRLFIELLEEHNKSIDLHYNSKDDLRMYAIDTGLKQKFVPDHVRLNEDGQIVFGFKELELKCYDTTLYAADDAIIRNLDALFLLYVKMN